MSGEKWALSSEQWEKYVHDYIYIYHIQIFIVVLHVYDILIMIIMNIHSMNNLQNETKHIAKDT